MSQRDGYTESKFTKMADDISDRCNSATHPADIDALDIMVDTADEMIDAFPNTRKSVTDEVAIIVRYSTIKKFFPTV